jgi:hypothetical protein
MLLMLLFAVIVDDVVVQIPNSNPSRNVPARRLLLLTKGFHTSVEAPIAVAIS